MKKFKIVIIEDEMDLLKLISELCSRIVSECFEFRTFEDFIYKFEHINPDLIITDLNLPGLSGNEVIKTIRNYSDKVPIIMISGSSTSSNMIEALNLGANDFIVKPFDFEVFFVKIKKLLDTFRHDEAEVVEYLTDQKIIKRNNMEIYLTNSEAHIFEILYFTEEHFASREQLHLQKKSRSLDVHINKLRKKIAVINLEIDTVRNKGYRLKGLESLESLSNFENIESLDNVKS